VKLNAVFMRLYGFSVGAVGVLGIISIYKGLRTSAILLRKSRAKKRDSSHYPPLIDI